MAKKQFIQFVSDKSETSWGFQFPDGRIASLVSKEDGRYFLRYDVPFDYATGEIKKKHDGMTVTLNVLKLFGGHEVHCYDDYEINFGEGRPNVKEKMNDILKEFREHGFNVTEEAVLHAWVAWSSDMKSGYRDEKNGYHLFCPCGCNPFSLRATTLNPLCADWQTTYYC